MFPMFLISAFLILRGNLSISVGFEKSKGKDETISHHMKPPKIRLSYRPYMLIPYVTVNIQSSKVRVAIDL